MRTVNVVWMVVCMGLMCAGALSQHERVLTPADLGRQVQTHLASVTVVDQVVLVDTVDDWLAEVSRWSDDRQWPVLFMDDPRSALFTRRFDPRRVMHRPQGEFGDSSRERIEALAERTTARGPLRGVVVSAPDDPAVLGGLALALGHGQPLYLLDDAHAGSPRDVNVRMSHDDAVALHDAIGVALRDITGDPPTITLALNAPARADLRIAADQRVNAPKQANPAGPLALADWLGRDTSGVRRSFVGQIIGDERQAVYMAMCALFLDREDWLLVNTYPINDGRRAYDTAPARDLFTETGVGAQNVRTSDATLADWRRMFRRGADVDALMLNSQGGGDWFQLSGGPAQTDDIPALQRPVAIHMIHSYAAKRPADANTIAGRWLEFGAYVFIGSVEEPTLAGFLPPTMVAERLLDDVPMLIAARHWTGPMARTWRITTLGDPLMTMRSRRERTRPDDDMPGDLRASLPTLMRDGRAGAALRAMYQLGEDAVALRYWRMLDDAQRIEAARAMLPIASAAGGADVLIEVVDRLPRERSRMEAAMIRHRTAGDTVSGLR